MSYYKDLTRLDSLFPQGYLDLRLQLFEAVAFIHEQGIVHRDIKRGNILFELLADSRILLHVTDFNTAAFYKDGDQLFFGFCGTSGFTAPEVDDGGTRYDPRSADVWAAANVVIAFIRFSGFNDKLPRRIMGAAPSLRPTAAALFAELSGSKSSQGKRSSTLPPEELPSPKRRAMEFHKCG